MQEVHPCILKNHQLENCFVDSICRDSADMQYMIIQKISQNGKPYVFTYNNVLSTFDTWTMQITLLQSFLQKAQGLLWLHCIQP